MSSLVFDAFGLHLESLAHPDGERIAVALTRDNTNARIERDAVTLMTVLPPSLVEELHLSLTKWLVRNGRAPVDAQDEARAWDAYAAAALGWALHRDTDDHKIDVRTATHIADAMLEQRRKRFGGGK